MSIATGYLTANNAGLLLPSVPAGTTTVFPGTFAVWGSSFGGGTIKLQAGFVDTAGTTNWVDTPNASFTAAGAVSVSVRCDKMQIVLSGAASPNIGYWLG